MKESHIDAVIFDLDGVVTKTADVHSRAWKKMFDEYLMSREKRFGEPFSEFSHERDYLRYVDGKPRYNGVEGFLRSRNISIPYGDPNDDENQETICGLGNRKNKVFNDVLAKEGVEVFHSTVSLIRILRQNDIRVGIASSSRNCSQVLEAAGLVSFFETRVDGIVSSELGLKGKPEPDIFITACRNLDARVSRSVVVEDAESGVRAGAAGNFGLVIGVAREGNAEALKRNGADIVVEDLGEISIRTMEEWFDRDLPAKGWSIEYHDVDKSTILTREALLSVGNGYMATRGAWDECDAGEHHYPGTYIAGVYNRLDSTVGGRKVTNEDFVNCINWLPVRFGIGTHGFSNPDEQQLLKTLSQLCLRSGELKRYWIQRDRQGRETEVTASRFISMDNPHLAVQQYTICPLNYEDEIVIGAGLDGDIENLGVQRYRQLGTRHLEAAGQGSQGDVIWLASKTSQSDIIIAAAARLSLVVDGEYTAAEPETSESPGSVFRQFVVQAKQGCTITLHKTVAIFTSRDQGIADPLEAAIKSIEPGDSYGTLLENSSRAWNEIWDEIDIEVAGDRLSQKLLRLHLYHVMVSASPHNEHIDAGLTARGLHGEAYRGHVFWDELFILPFYDIHFPQTARSLLMYRCRRLGKAMEYAKEQGYQGAMFPWQSGSDGREETQVLHLNPVSGEWGPDHSSLQRHVSLAIAFNVHQYFHITGDEDFLKSCGMELMLQVAVFWTWMALKDPVTGRYSIQGVMGPDEFHEKYPDATKGGLKDNAYTNLMVAWLLGRMLDYSVKYPEAFGAALQRAGLSMEITKRWSDIAANLNLSISPDGIIAQFDGYFDLRELDWHHYRRHYGNIHRLDRILKAEGKSPDAYQLAKQADTLMIFYNLLPSEVTALLTRMKYPPVQDYVRKNLEYYIQRTSHGSTLSRVVHARLANMTGDTGESWSLYSDALASDYADIQGGTTGEGIHLGVMAGTVMIALDTFAGLDLRTDGIVVNPNMPENWESVSFGIRWRGNRIRFRITPNTVQLMADQLVVTSIPVMVKDTPFLIGEGEHLYTEY